MGHVICSGGIEGKFGCGAAGWDVVVLDFEDPVPHAMEAEMPAIIVTRIRAFEIQICPERSGQGNALIVLQTSISKAAATSGGREARLFPTNHSAYG